MSCGSILSLPDRSLATSSSSSSSASALTWKAGDTEGGVAGDGQRTQEGCTLRDSAGVTSGERVPPSVPRFVVLAQVGHYVDFFDVFFFQERGSSIVWLLSFVCLLCSQSMARDGL